MFRGQGWKTQSTEKRGHLTGLCVVCRGGVTWTPAETLLLLLWVCITCQILQCVCISLLSHEIKGGMLEVNEFHMGCTIFVGEEILEKEIRSDDWRARERKWDEWRGGLLLEKNLWLDTKPELQVWLWLWRLRISVWHSDAPQSFFTPSCQKTRLNNSNLNRPDRSVLTDFPLAVLSLASTSSR